MGGDDVAYRQGRKPLNLGDLGPRKGRKLAGVDDHDGVISDDDQRIARDDGRDANGRDEGIHARAHLFPMVTLRVLRKGRELGSAAHGARRKGKSHHQRGAHAKRAHEHSVHRIAFSF